MSKGPAEKLEGAAKALSSAAMLIRMELPTIEAFLKECDDMENFGHVLDSTLYNKSERRAVSAVLEPLFKAATDFIRAYDTHLARANTAGTIGSNGNGLPTALTVSKSKRGKMARVELVGDDRRKQQAILAEPRQSCAEHFQPR